MSCSGSEASVLREATELSDLVADSFERGLSIVGNSCYSEKSIFPAFRSTSNSVFDFLPSMEVQSSFLSYFSASDTSEWPIDFAF